MHDNVHLVRLRVWRCFRGDFSLIQTLLTKCLSQPLQRLVDGPSPVRLPQRDLHRRRCRGFAWRRGKALDAHLVEKQILSHHEIQARPIRLRR